MSYNPATLVALGNYAVSIGGRNLGIVGSIVTHCKGYHLGKDRIYGPCACKPSGVCVAGVGDADYSMTNFPARDKQHATNAAMAIDLSSFFAVGGTEVSYAKWLGAQCAKSSPDTLDIRAVNYGWYRYDKINGVSSGFKWHNVNETGHVHTEYFRDSELRDKTATLKRWVASLTKTVACSGGYAWSQPNSTSTQLMAIPQGTKCVILGTVAGGGWSFNCNGAARSGTAWYKVAMINGQTAMALYHSSIIYIATGRF